MTKIILNNNNTTSFSLVFSVLTEVLNKTKQEAFSLMMKCHSDGHVIVFEDLNCEQKMKEIFNFKNLIKNAEYIDDLFLKAA